MKRFWSVLLTVCLVFSTLVAVLTITAFASNHVEKDKGLVISSYRAANLKNYGSDIYQTEKHLDSVPISFEAWVYLESSISGDAGVIIGNHSAKAGGRFSFKISENYSPTLIYYAKSGGYHKVTFSSCASEMMDKWTQVVIVWDKESAEFICYINGEFKESIPTADTCRPEYCTDGCNGIFSLDSAEHYPIWLGGDNNYLNEKYFEGRLQDVAIYRDVLTAEEVRGSYENGIDAKNKDLILFYDITSADKGKDIRDESGNGYDLTYSKDWMTENEMEAEREKKGFSGDYAYSLAIIGDPQYATRLYPDTVRKMYKWIVDNAEEKNIEYVIGLGDITDNCTEKEWLEAADALKILENAGMEYSFIRGNHDTGNGVAEGSDIRPELYDELFASNSFYVGQFQNNGGFYKEGSVINTYRTIKLGDSDWLIINLDWCPKDAVLEWAASVVEQYPNHRTLVVTHEYVGAYGEPNSIGLNMWDKLVSRYANIELVLAGHVSNDDIKIYQSKGIHGNTVTQMLIDPQRIDFNLKGVGLVAMFYFNEDGTVIDIEYYSTVKNRYYKNINQQSVDLRADVDAPENVWDGVTSKAPEGSGTKSDPYLISEAANLLWMAEQHFAYDGNGNVIFPSEFKNPFENKYFLQTADIDLFGKTLYSIGYAYADASSAAAFGGHYDGGGYKIFNGNIQNPIASENASTALFGEIYGASIENLDIYNLEVAVKFNTGILVGRANAPKNAESFNTVRNCIIDSSVRFVTASERAYTVGAAAAIISGATVENVTSYVRMTVRECASVLGALIGRAEGKNLIVYCENYGDITVKLGTGNEGELQIVSAMLGVIGENSDNTILVECRNYGDVSVSGTPVSNTYVGAVLGENKAASEKNMLVGVKNLGKVIAAKTSDSLFVGGLIGYSTGAPLTVCSSTDTDSQPDFNGVSPTFCADDHGYVKISADEHSVFSHNSLLIPHSYNEYGYCEYCEVSFKSAQVVYANDISVRYRVKIINSDILGASAPTLKFVILGKEYTVSEFAIDNGDYIFVLDNIKLEHIGENIDAYLSVNGRTVAEKKGYSVRENLLLLRDAYSTNEELVNLVSDLLIFADASQRYNDLTGIDFINAGVSVDGTENLPLESDAPTVELNKNKNLKMTSAEIVMDGSVGIKFIFTILDISKATIKINSEEYDNSSLVSLGGDEYALVISGISALDFDTRFVIELIYKTTKCAEISYSINSLVYEEANKIVVIDQAKHDLMMNIYRLGYSAECYVNSEKGDK